MTEFFVNKGIYQFSYAFHKEMNDFLFPQIFHVDSTGKVKNYRFALMLVVISFTTSAKAGSERICISTFFNE